MTKLIGVQLNDEHDLEMTDVVGHVESDPTAKEQLESVCLDARNEEAKELLESV